MILYRILVHDERSADPIELAAEFGGDERAYEFAHERLKSSPRYTAIEVWRGPVRLGLFMRDPAEVRPKPRPRLRPRPAQGSGGIRPPD